MKANPSIANVGIGPIAVCLVLAWDHVEADLQHRSETNLAELMRLSV